MMVAANLAHDHPTWGVIIYVDQLKMFLKGHRCNNSTNGAASSFEVVFKKFDPEAYILGLVPNSKNWKNVYVIRIGRVTDQSPPKIELQKDGDSRMITTPP